MTNQLVTPWLAKQFPAAPPLAYWELAFREEVDGADVIKDARGLKGAGFSMDPADLEEKTGYKVQPDASAPPEDRNVLAGALRGPAVASEEDSGVSTLKNTERPVKRENKPSMAAKLAKVFRMLGFSAEVQRESEWADLLAEAVAEGMESGGEELGSREVEEIRNAKRGKGGKESQTPKAEPTTERIYYRDEVGRFASSPVKSWVPDQPLPLADPRDAARRIRRGVTLTDPTGESITVDGSLLTHWESKTPEDRQRRLLKWPEAEATINHPHEIWEAAGQKTYLRRFGGGEGVVSWVSVKDGRMVTYDPKTSVRSLARHQSGRLAWSRETTPEKVDRTGGVSPRSAD